MAAQRLAIPEPAYQWDPGQLAGWTGSGYPVVDLLEDAPIRTRTLIGEGVGEREAFRRTGLWLAGFATTLIADTARTAAKIEGASRRVRTWVRALSPPSCGRCVILAGRTYRTAQPFQRHPRCDCINVPAGPDAASQITDPKAWLDQMNEDQLAKALGSRANAQAYRDGADPYQIISAYRPPGGKRRGAGRAIYTAQKRDGVRLLYGPAPASPTGWRRLTAAERAQHGGVPLKYTTEGTTKRGWARKAMNRAGLAPGQVRLMPETIYQLAGGDLAIAIRLLRTYGWILP
jgi:hypothetical protein